MRSKLMLVLGLLTLWAGTAVSLQVHGQEEKVHPRLFFDREGRDQLRQKMEREPYKQMLEQLRLKIDRENKKNGVSDNPVESNTNVDRRAMYDIRARLYAVLYTVTGDQEAAKLSAEHALKLIDNSYWANARSKGLTRGAGALTVAMAYDLCYDAWDESTRDKISKALAANAQSMMKSMGRGGNYRIANNWSSVRFSSIGLQVLAHDEPGQERLLKDAYQWLLKHLDANMGEKGWNPEGIGYTLYPWTFAGPFAIAAERAGHGDLRKVMKHRVMMTWWATYAASVPIPTMHGQVGLRADLADDHPALSDRGGGLGFYFMNGEKTKAAWKYMYERFNGEQGSGLYTLSSSDGLFSMLLYPDDIEEKNPADVFGLNHVDESHGVAIFRNRFQDENDIVAVANAAMRRPRGAHAGPDTNTFRIFGLGGYWVTGGGRTGRVAGQTNLFAYSPDDDLRFRGSFPGQMEWFLFNDQRGDGVVKIKGSCMGVQDHERYMLVDFDEASGAEAVFISHETSKNGKAWRLNTPEFNEVTTEGNRFVITGPNGAKMLGVVIEGKDLKWKQGMVERGGGAGHAGFPYRGKKWINNKWIEFNCDGEVLVVMMLLKKDAKAPEVNWEKTELGLRIKVGDSSYDF